MSRDAPKIAALVRISPGHTFPQGEAHVRQPVRTKVFESGGAIAVQIVNAIIADKDVGLTRGPRTEAAGWARVISILDVAPDDCSLRNRFNRGCDIFLLPAFNGGVGTVATAEFAHVDPAVADSQWLPRPNDGERVL